MKLSVVLLACALGLAVGLGLGLGVYGALILSGILTIAATVLS